MLLELDSAALALIRPPILVLILGASVLDTPAAAKVPSKSQEALKFSLIIPVGCEGSLFRVVHCSTKL